MPELPEVERFRQILLPLVSPSFKKEPLSFELHGEKLPRKWVSEEAITSNTNKWCCVDVIRKGKQLCMVLEPSAKKASALKKKYFYLHMGMTGRLASPSLSCSWGHKYVLADSDEDWPPKFTYLTLTAGSGETVAFADPRKFGSCKFEDGVAELDELAPDGLNETVTASQRETMAARIANRKLGIKAVILDQKRVVSGVGNWVADEVLYQSKIHPDQNYLTLAQSLLVVQNMHNILSIAVSCLERDVPYPATWLFGYRWTGKKAGKDCEGRSLFFLQSGGRTSAIVPQIQILELREDLKSPKEKKKETKAKTPKASKEQSAAVEVEAEKIKVTKQQEKYIPVNPKGDLALPKKRKADSTEAPSNDAKWNAKFHELKQFASVHGHCNVVNRSGPLGVWVNHQKMHQRKNKLCEERKKRLLRIGFDFSRRRVKPDDTKGNANIAELKQQAREPVDLALSKKRKVGNKETSLTDTRRRRSSRTIDATSQKKGQTPYTVCPAAVPIISPTSSNVLAKSSRKSATKSVNQKFEVQKIAEKSNQQGEEEEESILKQVDQSVKDNFRTPGFAKWRSCWLPILRLGPLDVSPGPVRDEWFRLFRKTNVPPRLVYWYGSPHDDLSSSFSFVKANATIGFAAGVERNYLKLTPVMEKKRASGKKLGSVETILVEGLVEIEREVNLLKDDRLAWLKM